MDKNLNNNKQKEKEGEQQEESCLQTQHSILQNSEGTETESSVLSENSCASMGSRKKRKKNSKAPGDTGVSKRRSAVDKDGFVKPIRVSPNATKELVPNLELLSKEMEKQPTSDLPTKIYECLKTIESVTDKSKTMKKELAQALRIAVRTAEAATQELAVRSTSDRLDQLERENAALRAELDSLNLKIDRLGADLSIRNKQMGSEKNNTMAEIQPPDRPNYVTVEQVQAIVEGKLAYLIDQISPKEIYRPPLGKKVLENEVVNRQNTKVGSNKKRKENMSGVRPENTEVFGPTKVTEIEQPRPNMSWSEVTSRNTKRKNKETATQSDKKQKKEIPKAPKTAAVGITVMEGTQTTYAEVMAAAKSRIKLADIGITEVRQRKAINGGLLLEVTGSENVEKADKLAERLHLALSDFAVRVTRPTKMAELKVLDLDQSVTKQEVAEAISKLGDCKIEDVRVGDIYFHPKRLGMIWVRCPLAVAGKINSTGRLLVGWVSARVELLPARPLQCYRCLEVGHTRSQCSSEVDRSTVCYKCGGEGHKASGCEVAIPNCPLCSGLRLASDHRMGNKKCLSQQLRNRAHRHKQVLNTSSVNMDSNEEHIVTESIQI